MENKGYADFGGVNKVYYGECGNGEWVLSDQFQVTCEKDVLRMCYIKSREGPLKIRGKHCFFNLSSPQAAQAQNFLGIFFFHLYEDVQCDV